MLPILLMLALAVSRWPGLMPGNFSAVYALAFCGGVFLPRKLALWLPISTLFVTDLLLNLHYRAESQASPGEYVSEVSFFSPYLLANYVAYGLLIWFGTRFKPNAKWFELAGGGILGALVFYLISNTASWAQFAGYEKSIAGWIQALTVGLPGFPPTWMFALKTLLSGGLFTGLFVGAMRLAEREVEAKDPETDAETEGDNLPEPEEAKA